MGSIPTASIFLSFLGVYSSYLELVSLSDLEHRLGIQTSGTWCVDARMMQTVA